MDISGKPGYGKFGSPDEDDEDELADDEEEFVCEESPSSELQLPLQLEAVDELPADVAAPPPPPPAPAAVVVAADVAAAAAVPPRVLRLRCAASLSEEAPLWRRIGRRCRVVSW